MPDPIVRYGLPQFAALLAAYKPGRKINAVHLHHTWRPNHAQFRGKASVEAMRRFHMETNGWSDIAQHLTIDPAGGLWSGRRWTQSPASSGGANGSALEGPFMIEMVGDFDLGRDLLEGPQRAAMLEVVARLVIRFGLDAGDNKLTKALRFHRELNQGKKTCPGSGVDLAVVRGEVAAEVARLRAAAAAPRGARKRAATGPDPRLLAGYEAILVEEDGARRDLASPGEGPEAEISEHPRALEAQLTLAADLEAGRPAAASRGAAAGSPWAALEPHVLNLRWGRLSAGGEFTTDPASDLDELFEVHLPAYCRRITGQGGRPRLMLHAHGGLVKEKKALDYAAKVRKWWLDNDVYPLFFIWETGLSELEPEAGQGERGARGPLDGLVGGAAELLGGRKAWDKMKAAAERSSSGDIDGGVQGGAHLFARRLARFATEWAANGGPALEVHAVGHSAGSIFHAHFLDLLAGKLGVSVSTLSLLAPAIRTELFHTKLLPLLTGPGKKVDRCSMFTMTKKAERDDKVTIAYRKSLLYMVSEHFEDTEDAPILGLEESLRRDPQLLALFGLDGTKPAAELRFSPTPEGMEPKFTLATTHGGFDNDLATMESVARRVLGLADGLVLRARFPAEAQRTVAVAPQLGAKPPRRERAKGAKKALCVGIDRYETSPLTGCVNDAETWGRALTELGFHVTYLRNEEATRERMMDALSGLVAEAVSGDVLAFQYAGHGTQFEDENRDEEASSGEAGHDLFDEAFVPFDYATGAYLLDDDLAQLASRLKDGVNLTMFMDCCNSGSNHRAAPPHTRALAPAERIRLLLPTPEMKERHRAFRAGSGGGRRAANVPPFDESRAIHFAACRDREYAYEREGHGEFTLRAVPLLARAVREGWPSRRFQEEVVRAFGPGSRQNPVFDPPSFAGQRLLAPLGGRGEEAAPSRPSEAAGGELRDLLARVEALGREVQAIEADLRGRLGQG